MVKQDEFKPGQKFKAVNGFLWQVEKMAPVASAIPHVTMVGVDDRSTQKIIAQSALMDHRLFVPVEAA